MAGERRGREGRGARPSLWESRSSHTPADYTAAGNESGNTRFPARRTWKAVLDSTTRSFIIAPQALFGDSRTQRAAQTQCHPLYSHYSGTVTRSRHALHNTIRVIVTRYSGCGRDYTLSSGLTSH
ncbi:hypothetical protein E2C01_096463 [Portunus trituberculatus]|uniref:Uncharacterized protein n=1 Tax=Portunus trituberculatus TaxID=210409 RepID=A0A5B7K231_PORTR|nr:hypothetical protein [Portunus trituberculatus]